MSRPQISPRSLDVPSAETSMRILEYGICFFAVSAALLLGPVIVTQSEEDLGPKVTVRVRQDSMPTEASAQTTPEPGNLLAAFQKLQGELLRDLSVSAALHAHRNRARG